MDKYTNDKNIEELFIKYQLDLFDRIVAVHLIDYIEDNKVSVADMSEQAERVMQNCVSYYENKYNGEGNISDSLLQKEYIIILKGYCGEKNREKLNRISDCILDILKSELS